MAIRVLATIPDLAADPQQRAVAPKAVTSPDREIPTRKAPRRSHRSFPGVSIAALTLVAAAIWSLVAIREATRPEPDQKGSRIAAEPTDHGATETTRR